MKRKKRPKTATTLSRASARILRSLVIACLTLFLTISSLIINRRLQAREQPKLASYALIFGTVWGPDDRPVYGVEVKIRVAEEKKPRWKVHSNHLGEFEQRVPAEKQDYVLWADLKGYRNPAYRHLPPGPEVTVHVESDERVDTGLHLK
jgi:hypothetical protein